MRVIALLTLPKIATVAAAQVLASPYGRGSKGQFVGQVDNVSHNAIPSPNGRVAGDQTSTQHGLIGEGIDNCNVFP